MQAHQNQDRRVSNNPAVMSSVDLKNVLGFDNQNVMADC